MVTAALAMMTVGFAHKSLCVVGSFEVLKYKAYCYSDIVPLFAHRGLMQGRIPYLQNDNEYPVGTGLVMWGASLVDGGLGYYLSTTMGLMALGVLTAWLLYRLVGDRAMYFAAAPTLALYAFLNWDLVPVALSVAGLYAFLRYRDALAGVWFGLGTAAKLYPVLFVATAAFDRLRGRRRPRAVLLVLSAGLVWLALNLPFAIAAFERWSAFFRFSSQRDPTPGTLWYTVCRALTGSPGCGIGRTINIASVVAFILLLAVVWRYRLRREPDFPRWTLGLAALVAFLLTSKVYSPQYSLWLLPWFALALPDVRLFLAFEGADLAMFFAEFSYLGAGRGGGLPAAVLGGAVLARACVLGWMLVVYARGRVRMPEPVVQVVTSTSPSSSS